MAVNVVLCELLGHRREDELMDPEETAKIAGAVNILGNFCGPRNIEELTTAALQGRYHIPRVDVAVLFGGSILAGGDGNYGVCLRCYRKSL